MDKKIIFLIIFSLQVFGDEKCNLAKPLSNSEVHSLAEQSADELVKLIKKIEESKRLGYSFNQHTIEQSTKQIRNIFASCGSEIVAKNLTNPCISGKIRKLILNTTGVSSSLALFTAMAAITNLIEMDPKAILYIIPVIGIAFMAAIAAVPAFIICHIDLFIALSKKHKGEFTKAFKTRLSLHGITFTDKEMTIFIKGLQQSELIDPSQLNTKKKVIAHAERYVRELHTLREKKTLTLTSTEVNIFDAQIKAIEKKIKNLKLTNRFRSVTHLAGAYLSARAMATENILSIEQIDRKDFIAHLAQPPIIGNDNLSGVDQLLRNIILPHDSKERIISMMNVNHEFFEFIKSIVESLYRAGVEGSKIKISLNKNPRTNKDLPDDFTLKFQYINNQQIIDLDYLDITFRHFDNTKSEDNISLLADSAMNYALRIAEISNNEDGALAAWVNNLINSQDLVATLTSITSIQASCGGGKRGELDSLIESATPQNNSKTNPRDHEPGLVPE